MGDWLITRIASENTFEWLDFISSVGSGIGTLPNNNENSLRPVFYLNTNVYLIGGTGTIVDPYRIN